MSVQTSIVQSNHLEIKLLTSLNAYLKKVIDSGHLPEDSDDEKLRKSSLVVMSIPFAFAGLIWGGLYMTFGLYLPGAIPMGYGILSLISFLYFIKTKKYKFYRVSQIFLILILPFLLQISLGGFIPSSGVIMWAVISPLSAMVFFNTKHSFYWFAAYMCLVVVAYLMNDYLLRYFNWGIDDGFINLFFLMNILAVSSLIYAIQYYFVGNQTNLKKAVEQQAKELQELDKIKSRFFANISHEFRTPLTVILGLVNKQVSSQEKNEDLKDSLTIQRNASRLLQLINQLLDLSKLESGEVELQASNADIAALLKRSLSMFESMANEKQINIMINGVRLKQAEDRPVVFCFDPEKIQKVLANLISNAFKFTPHGGKIEVGVIRDQDQVKLTVANSGDGIPSDSLAHVFDRFFQVDGGSTRAYEGTGIGLALVKEMVELHEGSVDVSSQQGWTVFSIELPTYHQPSMDQSNVEGFSQNEMIVPVTSEERSSNERISVDHWLEEKQKEFLVILIVEDNVDLREYIGTVLEREYTIIMAQDGQDGLEKAVEQIPDLIVSDVMMPRMDGYALCQSLKSNPNTNHIPVVLLTAKADRENKLEGLEIGADDYLIKPFDEEELKVRIKNLIAVREQLQLKYQKHTWVQPSKIKPDSVHQKFLNQIKEVIENQLSNETFSVEDLGHEMAMSRSQIHRKLKALTDLSATAFIRNYRLHRAAEYLKNQTGTITEIAYSVGFNSQTYFSSSFQDLFGCSPSEYGSKK